MKNILLLSICVLSVTVNAQNLIPNSSFEKNNDDPANAGDWNVCKGWSNSNMHPHLQYPYGSPDYLNVNGQGSAKLPASTFGYVQPHTGKAIMGMLGFHGSECFREYLACKLLRPMKVGNKYKISFWITNGEKDRYGNLGCDNMGVKLSMKPIRQKDHEALGVVPTVKIEKTFFSEKWEQFTFEFVADSAYTNFIFGNFYGDEKTTRTEQEEGYNGSAYYFVDDFEIVGENEEELTINEDEEIIADTAITEDLTIEPIVEQEVVQEIVQEILLTDPFPTDNLPNEIILLENDIENLEQLLYVIPNSFEEYTIDEEEIEDSEASEEEETAVDTSTLPIFEEKIIEIAELDVTVFPNPTSSYFNIRCDGFISYSLFSPDGKLLFTGDNINETVNVSTLPVGTYLARIITTSGVATKRIEVIR